MSEGRRVSELEAAMTSASGQRGKLEPATNLEMEELERSDADVPLDCSSSPSLVEGPTRSLPAIDYVLVFDPSNETVKAQREQFETAMKSTGLRLSVETLSPHKAFLKVFASFGRLAYEAEQCQLEMDLANCPIDPDPPGLMDRLMERFVTDNEIDYVSGPFEMEKLTLFDGHEDELSFFRSSLRSYLVHHILTGLQMDGSVSRRASRTGFTPETEQKPKLSDGKKQGLAYLLLKGVYQDAYILHDQSVQDPHYLRIKNRNPDQYKTIFDDPRKDLNETWTKFLKFQPLWKIRNYFGEKIAMYFAWQGLLLSFLWIPAIVGLCVVFYGMSLSANYRLDTYQRCKCIALNATARNNTVAIFGLPLQELKKNETFLEEHCLNKTVLDVMASDILGVVKESFNNEVGSGFSIVICVWGTLFLVFWKRKNAEVSYQWDCNNFEDTEPDRPQFSGTNIAILEDPITREYIWTFPGRKRLIRFLFSGCVIFFMMVLVFLTIAMSLVIKVVLRERWNCPPENPTRDQILECDPDNDHPLLCLLGGTILPSSITAVSVMVWGRLYSTLAEKLTDYENHQTQSDYQDALILKKFTFEFVNHYAILFYLAVVRPSDHRMQTNGLFNMGEEYQDTCPRGTCMSTLSFQVLLLMIVKPCVKFFQDILLPWGLRRVKVLLQWLRLKNAAVKIEDAARAVVDGEGGAEWVGPVGADQPAGKTFLEREYRKPPCGDFSLEEFTEKVMQFGYVVMFTAAFPLAPFLALVVNALDMRVDARRLLWFNRRPVAQIASDIGMWESILAFLNFCGVVTNAFLIATTSKLSNDMEMSWLDRMFTIIAFEHFVIVVMLILKVIIPPVPMRVKLAMRRERIQVSKIMAEGYIPRSGSVLSRAPSVIAPRRGQPSSFTIDQDLKAELARREKLGPSRRHTTKHRRASANDWRGPTPASPPPSNRTVSTKLSLS